MSHWTPQADATQQPIYHPQGHHSQQSSRDMARNSQPQTSTMQDMYASQAMTAAQLAMQTPHSSSYNGQKAPRVDDMYIEQQPRSRQPSRSAYAQQPQPAMSVRQNKLEQDDAANTHPSSSSYGMANALSPPFSSSLAMAESTPLSPSHPSRLSPTRSIAQQIRHDLSTPSFAQLNSPRTPGSFDHSSTTLNALNYYNNSFIQSSDSPQLPGSADLLSPGPVPQFKRLKSSHDLDPLLHVQPQFRRANPEGGFISVRSKRRCE